VKISLVGKDTIIDLEGGPRPQMYRDPAGLPTIGIGHLLSKDEITSGKVAAYQWVSWRDGLSREAIENLFVEDLEPVEQAINSLVRVKLTQAQFDALASWVYNVGVLAFRNSTLLRRLNQGDYAGVAQEMARWVYAAGVIVPALQARRLREIALWNTPAPPPTEEV
jgi:lysozyme